MPVLFILGPIFGIAAIAIIVAHAHKGSSPARPLSTPTPNGQHFELDQGMPENLVHQVLTALVHEEEAAQLDALAQQIGAKYPIAASELHAKATALRVAANEGGSPPPAGVAARAHPDTSSAATASSPDTGDAALILQAAMRAYAQETDPVSLEGFAESIRAKYPTATVLLLGRAREIRAAQTGTAATAPSPDPATVSAPPTVATVSPTKPTIYAVQVGDTPTVIAERFARDGKRWPELVAANPSKPTASDGSFATLRLGESLNLPASWPAASTAPPVPASPLPPKENHL
jgi:hypothetical protein